MIALGESIKNIMDAVPLKYVSIQLNNSKINLILVFYKK